MVDMESTVVWVLHAQPLTARRAPEQENPSKGKGVVELGPQDREPPCHGTYQSTQGPGSRAVIPGSVSGLYCLCGLAQVTCILIFSSTKCG